MFTPALSILPLVFVASSSTSDDAPPVDISSTAEVSSPPSSANPFTLGGYVEALYQWNFADPSNGLTHYRGFDNRHDTFTLSNVALDVAWDHEGLVGRVTLQVGHTPSTYYLAEPASAGAAATNASGVELWKYVQQAYAGYRFDVGGGLTVSAGLFLSPIGPESIAVKDDWNWSRSNLFFGLPFYHSGVRVAYAFDEAWTLTAAVWSGWNSVVDNNAAKSVSGQLTYSSDTLALSLLYFGGVERSDEGAGWRHLVDLHVTWQVATRLSLLAHVDAGLEPTALGLSGWVAGALYARVLLVEGLHVALRADAFLEEVASRGGQVAQAIFWPAAWVASGTATLDYRPHERLSLRLELRHDHAASEMFFGGTVDDTPNRVSQDTLTLGATAWF